MNDNFLSLNNAAIGDIVKVKKLNAAGAMRRRLQDLGIIEGARIECLLKGPGGDPIAYMVKGAVIALRNEISSEIIIDRK